MDAGLHSPELFGEEPLVELLTERSRRSRPRTARRRSVLRRYAAVGRSSPIAGSTSATADLRLGPYATSLMPATGLGAGGEGDEIERLLKPRGALQDRPDVLVVEVVVPHHDEGTALILDGAEDAAVCDLDHHRAAVC